MKSYTDKLFDNRVLKTCVRTEPNSEIVTYAKPFFKKTRLLFTNSRTSIKLI